MYGQPCIERLGTLPGPYAGMLDGYPFAESLDELSDIVVELFSGICNKNIPVPIVTEPPFSTDELQVCSVYLQRVYVNSQYIILFPIEICFLHFTKTNCGLNQYSSTFLYCSSQSQIVQSVVHCAGGPVSKK